MGALTTKAQHLDNAVATAEKGQETDLTDGIKAFKDPQANRSVMERDVKKAEGQRWKHMPTGQVYFHSEISSAVDDARTGKRLHI